MGLVSPNSVTFSASTRLKLAKYGTARSALLLMGLLGQGITVNADQTLREKKDGFPEVVVAQALQSQGMSIECLLREWRKDTITAALGMIDTDVTTVTGVDVAIVNETKTVNATGIVVLDNPIKAATLALVTNVGGTVTYSAATDYFLLPRDVEGRTIIVRTTASTIPANATLEIDYTWTRPAMNSYAIGANRPTRYYAAQLEETMTNGDIVCLYIPKASVSLRSGLNFNVVDTGAELAIKVTGIQDPSFVGIGLLEHIPA